eukprot:TRINITY_DN5516_c0_g1_i2.p1 TRINITY_DN5516_c0_g1~~TRINITY_DN5516_c0_g1_i2.p1  ORF type:complete len:677 (-),score=101.03 TRINITY_DN5516_c0_g1_i2:353-2383(-)
MDKLDTFFAKGLDKLSQVVEEYPQKTTPSTSAQQVSQDGFTSALKSWQQFNLAPRKAKLLETLSSLQSGEDNFDVTPLLEVAEALTNLPDPTIYLEHAQAVEVEIKDLKQKHLQLEKKIQSSELDNAEINQLIQQSNKLESERAEFQVQMEAKDAKLADLENQLKEVQERDLGMKDLEDELVRTKTQFRNLQSKYEESQAALFEIQSRKELDVVRESSETEGLLEEMQSLQARVTQLNHENDFLQHKLANAPVSDPAEVSQLRSEIEDLGRQLSAKNNRIRELEEQLNSESQQTELQSQIDEQQFVISELNRKVQMLPTVEEHQSALNRVQELQALVDVQIEKEGWEGKKQDGDNQIQLELVETLRERNRALSDEAVQLRRDLESQAEKIKTSANECTTLKSTIERKEGLIGDLESQLAEATKGSVDGDQMLNIISNQRDRFRDRVQKLEADLETSKDQIRESELKVQSINKDNVELVEKVRYLEQYRKQKQGGQINSNPKIVRVDDLGVASEGYEGGSRYECGPFQIGVKGSQGLRSRGANRNSCWGAAEQPDEELGELESKYSRAYEDKLNPFTKFQSSEVQRRMEKMQLPDRAVLSGSQILLASRTARIFVVVYTILLHVFVMTLLYIAFTPTREDTVYQGADENAQTVEQQIAAFIQQNTTQQHLNTTSDAA